MINFICYLILYCTLLLYCCRDNSSVVSKKDSLSGGSNPTQSVLQTKTTKETTQEKNNTLTAEEQQNRFKTFKEAIDKISLYYIRAKEQYENKSITWSVNFKKELESRKLVQRVATKYPDFSEWLSKNILKQKELDNAFDSAYNILERKRSIHARDKTLDQYISEAIDCSFDKACKDNKDSSKKYGSFGKYNNLTIVFFNNILKDIIVKDTNEEIFNALKKSLTNEIVDGPLYLLRNWQ
ncbi:Mlp family lipoprotein (plasmid) [Borrelia miyamotoi]|uniref:Mlp family lipoprotein n=2 Tax=Borrelia miyamotoi TaxID=47466 RepID=A0AAQ3CMI7_9SPIR|nr:Mlp family lipoprotein [Borrelia miyamotoi]ATQ15561.2 Mlp family lipoprotein [Borrelia miyamotoi]ATQ16583.2 Mlp family lipoprotein [Borrelia miyamotoi]ATQ17756.2 Mlp family lipoprotein [Borrelia miyamotoi]ATQ18976.2 Mlp family lipoprotein [Borrelia miyamotoi]ATQ20272.2 Mlp family lipoprotein [Borrelia miyamotoi]